MYCVLLLPLVVAAAVLSFGSGLHTVSMANAGTVHPSNGSHASSGSSCSTVTTTRKTRLQKAKKAIKRLARRLPTTFSVTIGFQYLSSVVHRFSSTRIDRILRPPAYRLYACYIS